MPFKKEKLLRMLHELALERCCIRQYKSSCEDLKGECKGSCESTIIEVATPIPRMPYKILILCLEACLRYSSSSKSFAPSIGHAVHENSESDGIGQPILSRVTPSLAQMLNSSGRSAPERCC